MGMGSFTRYDINKLRFLLIVGIFLLFSAGGFGQKYFQITDGVKSAYQSILELKLDKAQSQLDSLKNAEPDNVLVYHIENYIDFYKIFINEDYNEFVELEKNKKYRINMIKKGDKKSPYYRFSQAEIKLQWALARLKFEEYFTAAFEFRSAFKLLEKNKDEFPYFIENLKSLSVIHAIIGTAPKSLNLLKTISGIDGTLEEGLKEIDKVVEHCENNNFLFKDEVYTIRAFIAYHLESDEEKTWSVIEKANFDLKNSPLACFVAANMAQKVGKNDEAIEILESRPKGDGRLPFYYLDYMLGRSKLYKNDSDAKVHLSSFVNNFSGINYIKDAYLKLAWFELINNNKDAYWKNLEKCTYKGKSVVDEDKVAYEEAKKAIKPNPILLKARLLYDGSYFFKAYSYLAANEDKIGNTLTDKLEFNYRMARILQALKNYSEAIEYFDLTINLGKKDESYYACNSALQIGLISEKLKRYKKAKDYYLQCLDMNPSEYKSSLHQKAKAGLLRLKLHGN